MPREFSSHPIAYFITFSTHGTRLHGDARGSVDRKHNQFGAAYLPIDANKMDYESGIMKNEPIILTAACREQVHRAIVEVCAHRGWELHALNVRTNHVHVLVSTMNTPERVMSSFKSWSSRRLIEDQSFQRGTKIWSRHGSTRYIWNRDQFNAAGRYVVEGQGPDLNSEPRT